MLNQLTTARLSLAPLSQEDQDFVLELVNTPGWLRFIGDRKVHTSEEASCYIAKINGTPDLYYWVARLKDTGAPLGIITFLKRNYLPHFDLGFAFLPQYTGAGYAQEAAAAVLSTLSSMPGHATILATTLPTNERSMQLLTKLGFRFSQELQVGNDLLRVYAHHAKTPEVQVAEADQPA
ncbi:GNAT family N-acetyltransferase [Rufibacter psychrotolerans]|uniref:GNAT family N-acetyltransferase n=1 Tax=Rufibacter psychrotolerans TaxID=2812556 RepID=UPI001968131F|nr:GNAT family N-acetyltransferase [Rufibacter sp. SYSU D00308]